MKKDEKKLWDAFFACGLYLYLEKTGELDKEKLDKAYEDFLKLAAFER